MSYSFYVSQLKNLYLLHGTFKKSLESLKSVNANSLERILMLNKVEEELNEIEQRIAEFDNFLLKDIANLLKVYQNNEQSVIKEMHDKIRHDLLVSAHKINDLEKEHTIEDIAQNKTKQDVSYSFYVCQMEELNLLYEAFKNFLGPLKFLNLNCPEKSLMLNNIKEELKEIGRSIDAFDNFLIKDTIKLLKVYQNNEQSIIVEIHDKIRHDLSVLCHKFADLVGKQTINIDKRKALPYLIAPNYF